MVSFEPDELEEGGGGGEERERADRVAFGLWLENRPRKLCTPTRFL